MIDAPPILCWFCGATTEARSHGLCAPCHARSRSHQAPFLLCANCDAWARHRSRGLCGRCYQRLARTGTLPPPNRTTPEEVLGE